MRFTSGQHTTPAAYPSPSQRGGSSPADSPGSCRADSSSFPRCRLRLSVLASPYLPAAVRPSTCPTTRRTGPRHSIITPTNHAHLVVSPEQTEVALHHSLAIELLLRVLAVQVLARQDHRALVESVLHLVHPQSALADRNRGHELVQRREEHLHEILQERVRDRPRRGSAALGEEQNAVPRDGGDDVDLVQEALSGLHVTPLSRRHRLSRYVVSAVLEQTHQLAVLLLGLLLAQRVHRLQEHQELERAVLVLAALVLPVTSGKHPD